MVYGGYDIATVLGNIEDIDFYRIGRARVTRLYVYACVQCHVLSCIIDWHNNMLVVDHDRTVVIDQTIMIILLLWWVGIYLIL